MTKKDPDKNVYEELELLNALLIGFMVGTYDVLGKGGTQAVVNMAGKTVANEFLRFAKDKGKPIESLEDFQAFVTSYNLAGQMEFHEVEGKTFVRITDCKIHNEPYSAASKLVPGEQCVLEVNKSVSTA